MKRIESIACCLLLIAGLFSCMTDDVSEDCPHTDSTKKGIAQVMLSLSVPNSQLPSPGTRAISESGIHSLWLLEFENGALKEKADITTKYNNSNGKRLYVAIEETEHPVILSVVANVDVSALAIGTPQAETLRNLTFDNASSLEYIPMYGESQEFAGISRENAYDTSIELVRALAKIEIQYSSTQTAEDFTFLGIKVLNTNAKGYVADINDIPTQLPVGAVEASPVSVNEGLKTASIYLAETLNNIPNKVQVLVHGRYRNTDCWYRLDMIKQTEGTENIEITELKRNYKYVFALQNVNFEGRSETEAMNGEPDNKVFEARVMTLNAEEADILDITTDDYYFLGVNTSTLQLTQNAEGLCFTKLKILTNNHQEGWRIVDAPAGSTFSPGLTGGTALSDEQREVSTIWIYIDRNLIRNDFNFYVTTGKIRKTITVRMP
jgi:hypothetical protein